MSSLPAMPCLQCNEARLHHEEDDAAAAVGTHGVQTSSDAAQPQADGLHAGSLLVKVQAFPAHNGAVRKNSSSQSVGSHDLLTSRADQTQTWRLTLEAPALLQTQTHPCSKVISS
jgi:hypothetical protein